MRRAIQFLFGQFVPQCRHRIDKHFDDYYVLQYMDGGVIELRIDAGTYPLRGRWFWSSYPGPRIRFHAAPPGKTWVHRYLAFRGPAVKQWMSAGLFPVAPQQPAPGADYSGRFDDLLELSRRTDRWGLARGALLLETILVELAEARAKPHAVPAWLETGLAKITSAGAEIDYDELATEAGMSARTFRRRFAAALGTSPRSYAIACRVGHARHLLGATDLPIKSIAQQLGYRDVFFFSRQFTRLTGMSPAAYRRTKDA
ncbi:MAG TPA: AraC family transcriptional regulator [Tepidisphaeraceae bacterium]|nr:AraC family transcriptional regulator [Tepidisphaeraceae bacterium]